VSRQAKAKALGYWRVSTSEQMNGFGPDIQKTAIQSYCKANSLRLVRMYSDEGISGSNGLEDREGLAEALGALKAGEADVLVVYRPDRLARDLILQETLIERLREDGTPVRSATEDLDTDTDDPTRILIRQVLGVINQYERTVIKRRMMAGRRAKKAAGGFIGGRPPYGYRIQGGELVPDETEQEVVKLVQKLQRSGSSLREIADELDARGYQPVPAGPGIPTPCGVSPRPTDPQPSTQLHWAWVRRAP
jgi:DNA invertase Pin-like site-specific DNA recombinase